MAPVLQGFGMFVRLCGYFVKSLIGVVQSLYDVYIAIPISLGRLFQKGFGGAGKGGRRAGVAAPGAEAGAHG